MENNQETHLPVDEIVRRRFGRAVIISLIEGRALRVNFSTNELPSVTKLNEKS